MDFCITIEDQIPLDGYIVIDANFCLVEFDWTEDFTDQFLCTS